jgi:predicted nucleic acid-binding protein
VSTATRQPCDTRSYACISPFLARCWELRANLTSYDAAYVALAEALDVTLVTADHRISRAPGPRCTVEAL